MKFLEENLLDHLQRPEFAELHASLHREVFAKDAYISQPNIGKNRVFIVSTGRARVYLGYEEKEFNLGILTRGDIYSTHTRTFVQALEKTELLMIDVARFRQQMVGDPEITKAMVRVLGNILQTSFSIIDGLAFRDVNSRLVTLLVTEARKHGHVEKDGSITVLINLSVEQVARLVGSSRQTVSTLLSELNRAGLLERPERGKFSLPNILALELIAGLEHSE